MIRLGLRFALTGRASLVGLSITALAVGVGTAILLFALSLQPAMDVRYANAAWRDVGNTDDLSVPARGLLMRESLDGYAGRPILRFDVAALHAPVPVPPGLSRFPSAGEAYVSPALADLIASVPAAQLGDRFGHVAGDIATDGLKGPDELVAIVGVPRADLVSQDLSAASPSAPDQLGSAVVAVTAFPTQPHLPALNWLLLLLVLIAVFGALAPVVVFVATATRLSAARRERRLATLRLLGATNPQVGRMAAGEALAATLPGAVLGVLLFLLTRPLVAQVQVDRVGWFPDSIVPPLAQAVLLLIVVQVLGVATAVVALRRLAVSPLGVARRVGRRPLTRLRLVPLAGSILLFGATLLLATQPDGRGQTTTYLLVASFLGIILGIALAGPWLTDVIGRILHRAARGPALLIAARRLSDEPRAAFGAISGVVLAVFVSSAFFTLLGYIDGQQDRVVGSSLSASTLQADDRSGATVNLAQLRTSLESAAGVTGTVAVRQVDLPQNDPIGRQLDDITVWFASCADLAPAVKVAPCADGSYAVGRPGWTGLGFTLDAPLGSDTFSGPGGASVLVVPADSVPAPVLNGSAPIAQVLVATDGDLASIEQARTAIETAAPGWVVATPAEQLAAATSQITEVAWIVVLGTIGTLVMAGCSLAVAVAGGLIERQRPFALLRLTGMPLSRLRSIVMLEAAPPLLVAAGLSAALGVVVAEVLVTTLSEGSVPAPDASLIPLLGAGIAVALGIVALTFPLVSRTTSTEATRFE